MRIADVPSSDHEDVKVQDLLASLDVTPGRLDMNSYLLGAWIARFNSSDFAQRHDAVLPLSFVRVPDPLDIHVVVDLLNEFQSYDTVVGRLINLNGTLAFFGGEVKERVHPFRVEDLVDAV